MTSVQTEDVLREWRKTIHVGDTVRHADGTFGLIVGKADCEVYDFRVKWDDGDTSDSHRHNMYPPWWPESQWPSVKVQTQEERKA